LIQRDSFYVVEVDIFRAVMNWAHTNLLEGTPQLADVISAIRFSLMTPNELFSVVRKTGYVTSDTILDALQVQTFSRSSELPYRGVLSMFSSFIFYIKYLFPVRSFHCFIFSTEPNQNLATPQLGAEVLQGEMRSALLDGNTFRYDLEKGYTRHAIQDIDDQGIVVKLRTQSLINHIRMLLWDRDLR
jgi:BTB/POZ domain-containing protein 9